MKKINTFGLICGAIVWLCIMFYASTQITCMKTNSCGGDDMLSFALIGIGMLGPAYITALISSMVFK